MAGLLSPFLRQQNPYTGFGSGYTQGSQGGPSYGGGNTTQSNMPPIPGPPPKMQGLPAWWSQFILQGAGPKMDYESQIANLKPGMLSPAVLQALNQIKMNEMNMVNQAYDQNRGQLLGDLYGRGMAQSTNADQHGAALSQWLGNSRGGVEANAGNRYLSAMEQAYNDKLAALKEAAGIGGQNYDRALQQVGMQGQNYDLINQNAQAQYQYQWQRYQELMARYQDYLNQHPEMRNQQGGNSSNYFAPPNSPFGANINSGISSMGSQSRGKRGNDTGIYPQDAAFSTSDMYLQAPRGGPDAMDSRAPQPLAPPQQPFIQPQQTYSSVEAPSRTDRSNIMSGGSFYGGGSSGGGRAYRRPLGGGANSGGGGSSSQNSAIKRLVDQIQRQGGGGPERGPARARDPFGDNPARQDAAIKMALSLAQTVLPKALESGGYQTKNALGLLSATLQNAGLGSLGTYGANEGWGHTLFPGDQGGGIPMKNGFTTAIRSQTDNSTNASNAESATPTQMDKFRLIPGGNPQSSNNPQTNPGYGTADFNALAGFTPPPATAPGGDAFQGGAYNPPHFDPSTNSFTNIAGTGPYSSSSNQGVRWDPVSHTWVNY